MYCVLFDLDGTLLNSAPGIYQSIRYALEKQGLPIPNEDVLSLFIGPPLIDSFQEHCHQSLAEAERTLALFREDYLVDGKFRADIYEGIPDVLATLQKNGAMIGVATAKSEDVSIEILKHFGLDIYFDTICGADHSVGRNDKSAVLPEAVRRVQALAKERGTTLDRIYMIGDRKYDMKAAVDLGCVPVGVTYGFGSQEELVEAGATYLCDEPSEIPLTVSVDQF